MQRNSRAWLGILRLSGAEAGGSGAESGRRGERKSGANDEVSSIAAERKGRKEWAPLGMAEVRRLILCALPRSREWTDMTPFAHTQCHCTAYIEEYPYIHILIYISSYLKRGAILFAYNIYSKYIYIYIPILRVCLVAHPICSGGTIATPKQSIHPIALIVPAPSILELP